MASDETVLEPGMALAIEPGVSFGSNLCMVKAKKNGPYSLKTSIYTTLFVSFQVHEENIVVRESSSAELLSVRAPQEMVIVHT